MGIDLHKLANMPGAGKAPRIVAAEAATSGEGKLPNPDRMARVMAVPNDGNTLDNWLIAYQTGNSAEDGKDWAIVTDNVRASEVADFPGDAKHDAEAIALILNAYRTGRLAERDSADSARLRERVAELEAALREAHAGLLPFSRFTDHDETHEGRQDGILYQGGPSGKQCLPDSHGYLLVWAMDDGRAEFTAGQFRRAREAENTARAALTPGRTHSGESR